MFQPGKIYKVKVETAPGAVGFGRATVVHRSGTQILIQLRTSKGLNTVLPKGTRIWFVNDSPSISFNGLWSSTVVGTHTKGDETLSICATPRLEPLLQRRRTPRANLDVPVQVLDENEQKFDFEVHSIDISRSGIAIESEDQLFAQVQPGHEVNLVVQSNIGDIALPARVIRVQSNWLTQKHTAGLEFTKVSPAVGDLLEKLLTLLGAKPRKSDLPIATSQGGLSDWMPVGKVESDTKFVKGRPEQPNSEASQNEE